MVSKNKTAIGDTEFREGTMVFLSFALIMGFINLLYTSYYAELKDIFVLKITEDKKSA